MAIINIGNGKGGVNKTTISLQLALYCAEQGKKTLIIDLDGQEDLSRLLGKKSDFKGVTSADLFRGDYVFEASKIAPVTAWKCRASNVSDLLFYIPGDHAHLANINNNNDISLVKNYMANVKTLYEHFDVIINDTPPSLGSCQFASLSASTCSILPCMPDFDTCGAEKIEQYIKVYNAATQYFNPKLKPPVIVLTSVDPKSNIVQNYLVWAKTVFKSQMVERYIERSAAVLNSNSERRAVWFGNVSGNDRAKGASYRRVIEDIYNRII